ncbi:hypothetical protein H2198_002782 [Neophaeococcomyces mojaviensis]|uniref:Uncharacterized protein n=1 Tax=Neophaeococcomyces mojaviensis TaxID=3383035 RepID=A0ACC3AD74_9EURO|nr:hypothetical protein H2198_002782 [Knufia sp. JES_112]
MDHAPGVSLHEKWNSMTGVQQIGCIDAIIQKLKEMAEIEFPAYGSLYCADTSLKLGSQIPLGQNFDIGPHCGAMYWDCNVAGPRFYHNVKPNRGPCKPSICRIDVDSSITYLLLGSDLAAYANGLIDTGISRVPPDSEHRYGPRYQGSPSEHLRLLNIGRSVIEKMSSDLRIQNAATPTLFHPDLHKRNIFVSDDDPTVVTAIIDWQSASVEPAFWYTEEAPDFARLIPHPSLPDQYDHDSELCAKAFSLAVQYYLPKLFIARSLDENLFRPFRYCYRTWKDGAVVFRHELIELSKDWENLGFSGQCPFHTPGPEDLRIHAQEYRTLVAAHELKDTLSGLLNSAPDGWVPAAEWEPTLSAHKQFFELMLQKVLEIEDADDDDPLRTEEDVRDLWPFDL